MYYFLYLPYIANVYEIVSNPYSLLTLHRYTPLSFKINELIIKSFSSLTNRLLSSTISTTSVESTKLCVHDNEGVGFPT